MKNKKSLLPYIRSDREYESPLGQYRVDKGMTVAELAEKCGVTTGIMAALQNGMRSPYYLVRSGGHKVGDVRPEVERLCGVLGVDLADLFPRYICDIERYSEARGPPFVQSQLEEFYWSPHIEEIEKRAEISAVLDDVLKMLSPIKEVAMRKRFYEGMTLEDIGEDLAIGMERARQIEANSLEKMRNILKKYPRGKKLRDRLENYYPGITK